MNIAIVEPHPRRVLDAFRNGDDIHARTSRLVYARRAGVPCSVSILNSSR